MDNIDTFLQQFRATLAAMEDSLTEGDIAHAVEVGSALSAAIAESNKVVNKVKQQLREETLKQLKHEPGAVTFKGTGKGEVTVTNPEPRLALLKDADPELLKNRLGDDFDLYFDTSVSYKPKKAAGERIVKLASGDQKTILMTSLESVEGTPRVSFRKR